MDKLLYVAMAGAEHIDRAQTMHANNLANVGTTGFRADLAQARAVQVIGDGYEGRIYALTERPSSDYSPGPLVDTGRPLDVAIEGPGFLAVQTASGEEAYTRAGDLQLDSLGGLRTGQGHRVLGDGGPIAMPQYEQMFIGEDGTITVQPLGQGTEALVQLDRLKLVNPEAGQLTKGEDGLFHRSSGEELKADPYVRVVSGFVEQSNVNAVHELTAVLELARQFELEVRMMRTAEENSEAASQLLQVN